MSTPELDRLHVVQQVISGHLTQEAAAEQLGITSRQIRRLLIRFQQEGPSGLVRKQRCSAPHAYRASFKAEVLTIIATHYSGFGPTLAQEKLKTQRVHPLRARRPRRGELIQLDGSAHAWFEDRGPICTLLVAIDDATGELMALQFVEAESTDTYFALLKHYLGVHGKPVAYYTDRHSVFSVNAKEPRSGTGLTQFARALKTLNIESILATTPQAKGRVERANRTLQDRLIKEMRLAGINTLEAGNAFLESYMQQRGAQFAIAPMQDHDAHRPLTGSELENLEWLCQAHYHRTVSKQLVVQFQNQYYQLINVSHPHSIRQKGVIVGQDSTGHVCIRYQGQRLEAICLDKQQQQVRLADSKDINQKVEQAIRAQTPKKSHGLPLTIHGNQVWWATEVRTITTAWMPAPNRTF